VRELVARMLLKCWIAWFYAQISGTVGQNMTPVLCVHLSLLKLAVFRHEQRLTENKGVSDEALSVASTRFVQADSLSGTDVCHY